MIKKILFLFVFVTVVLSTANAQQADTLMLQPKAEVTKYTTQRIRYIKRDSRINWIPEEQGTQRRYTIALRPFYLINKGIKVDFELELKEPGQWLQFQAVYRGSGWYNGYDSGGWDIPESSGYSFSKLGGFGVGAAFKSMFTANGWYFSAAVTFNYYNVRTKGYYLEEFEQDGLQYYEYIKGHITNKYYNPAFSINIGKQVAITRNLFIDGYVGVGYTGSIRGKENSDYGKYSIGNMFSWGYSGITFNGGFRIGWLFRTGK